ncbi:VIT family protein [Lactococcus sp.]|uniref:VIT1/CCC1 transporter family protein n=1 Tax=Lactococcus sp. TaxID=44273 RepID=UPI002FC9E176
MKEKNNLIQRNNIVRASIMGANDGIISIAGIVIGVSGATPHIGTILLAGFAGTLAGTVSMAMGEYVSVSSQRDAQEKIVQEQKIALANDYQKEFDFVYEKYSSVGISKELAHTATDEMMKKDALATTVRERHGFTIGQELSAKAAAIASMVSFPTGALLPMLAISLIPKSWSGMVTFFAVLIALGFTGYAAAYLNGADKKHATFRNIVAGILTMVVTYLVGLIFKQGGL